MRGEATDRYAGRRDSYFVSAARCEVETVTVDHFLDGLG